MTGSINWRNVLRLSGAYVAYLIGSGFATGQEVLQFFTSFGINGLYGILTSTIFFSFFGAILLVKGNQLQLEKPAEIFTYYTGNVIGKLIEIFTFVFMFCIVVIMISGSGAIGAEHFHLPYWIGVVVMGVAALVTVWFGLDRLVDVIGVIGPVIVVFAITVGAIIFFRDLPLLSSQPIFGELSAEAKAIQPTSSPVLSGLLFFCYNILAGAVFLTELGKSANSKKEACLSGVIGGVALMAAVLFMVGGMLANFDSIITSDVPNLILGGTISPVIAFIYAVIILLGVYSTTAPMYWILKDEIMNYLPERFNTALIFVLGIIFGLAGLLPFGTLVGIIYPFVGYVGIFIVFIILGRTIYNKFKHGHI